MYKVLAVIIVSIIALTGCSNVDVYTFKKERVDQIEKGNKGYLTGEAPESDQKRNPNRTLIGIDIDMGSASGTSSSRDPEKSSKTIKTKSDEGTVTTVVEEEYIK